MTQLKVLVYPGKGSQDRAMAEGGDTGGDSSMETLSGKETGRENEQCGKCLRLKRGHPKPFGKDKCKLERLKDSEDFELSENVQGKKRSLSRDTSVEKKAKD